MHRRTDARDLRLAAELWLTLTCPPVRDAQFAPAYVLVSALHHVKSSGGMLNLSQFRSGKVSGMGAPRWSERAVKFLCSVISAHFGNVIPAEVAAKRQMTVLRD